jgi:acetyltransferase-like isoleucine patch superfamily enzyme
VSDIPDGVIAVGVPAKPMADRTTPSAEYVS